MKRYKLTSLLLAFCFAGCALWYGVIALRRNKSAPTLKTLEGDISALQDITLTGYSSDATFAHHFQIQDGFLSAKAVSPHKIGSFFPPHNSVSWKLVPETENPQQMMLYASVCYSQLSGFSEKQDVLARFSTGLTISDFDILSRSPTYFSGLDAQSALACELVPDGAVQEIDGNIYLAINLPWGGAKIYRVSDPIHDTNWRALEESEDDFLHKEYGSGECVLSYEGNEISFVNAILPLGDHIIVFTQTDAGEPCYHREENGDLQPLEPSDKNLLTAFVYDKDFQLQQTLPILEMPAGMLYNIEFALADQPNPQKDNLNLLMKVNNRNGKVAYGDPDGKVWQGALVLHLDEDDTIRALPPVLYPGSLHAQQDTDFPVTDSEICYVYTVQTDPSATRMATVRTLSEDDNRHAVLEVHQDNQLLYRGLLDNRKSEDLYHDYSMGTVREFVWPMDGSYFTNSPMVYCGVYDLPIAKPNRISYY